MNLDLLRRGFFYFSLLFLLTACTSPYLKGVSPDGTKAYVGLLPIEDTEAFVDYLHSRRSELDKINYLFNRFVLANDLRFHRDGQIYDWRDAYKGGKWVMRRRYESGDSARRFIRDHIWRSEGSGKPHLVEFPDGSMHIGYYLLLNELELLEAATQK